MTTSPKKNPPTRLFGTDGIRARAGDFPLDPETLVLIGRAVAERLSGRLLVGRDTRESGPWIFERLREGLQAGGATVADAGVLPTPAVALLVKTGDAVGGIMISASHNPFEDNGIKVFQSDGQKLDDAEEQAVESRVGELREKREPATGKPDAAAREDAADSNGLAGRYLDLLRSGFAPGSWLDGMRIVVDCANGATSDVAPQLLRSLGAKVTPIHASPNGRNINRDCGAVHTGSLVAAVREHGAELGVAYDGDADRAMFVAESGRLIDGDAVLWIMARRLADEGRLNPRTVIGTSMTNYALERAFADEGIGLVRVDVGDRYVFREMLDTGARLGGEPSGHIIFSDYRLSGDGLLTTLKLAETIRQNGPLGALAAEWKPFPQILKNVRVTEKVPLEKLPAVGRRMSEIRNGLEGRGRLVVRYSGTEPLLRVMVESDSAAEGERAADALIETISAELGP